MENYFLTIFTLVTILTLQHGNCKLDEDVNFSVLSRKIRGAVFPEGSNMGIVLATTIPLNVSGDVSVAWFVQAEYNFVENSSELIFPYLGGRTSRSLDRRRAYRMLENTFTRFGFHGRGCLLRSICEAAKAPLYPDDYNGLLGELLHIIFTPSSSLDEDLPPDFSKAEQRGINGENCRLVYRECTAGLFDIFTFLGE